MIIPEDTYNEMKKLIAKYESDELTHITPQQPYITTVTVKTKYEYNPDFGDDRPCICGHPYYRHFDTYEDMTPVGCKYCQCHTFIEYTNTSDENNNMTNHITYTKDEAIKAAQEFIHHLNRLEETYGLKIDADNSLPFLSFISKENKTGRIKLGAANDGNKIEVIDDTKYIF